MKSLDSDDQRKGPDTLEREVDQARARLSRTVDALGDKLSPGELLDQALRLTREHGGEFGRNLGGQIKRNPLPLLLTGVGLAWMMSATNAEPGDALGVSEDGITGDTDVGLSVRAGDKLSAAGDKLSQRSRRLKSDARRGAAAVADRTGTAARSLRSQARTAQQSVQTLMQEQPLMVGALGVAFGAALGALVPPSEAEDRILGASSDRLSGKAGDLAAEKYERLRQTAEQTAKQV